jgi:hypothetical protein
MMACASMLAEILRSMGCAARKRRVRNLPCVEEGSETESTWDTTTAIPSPERRDLRNEPTAASSGSGRSTALARSSVFLTLSRGLYTIHLLSLPDAIWLGGRVPLFH